MAIQYLNGINVSGSVGIGTDSPEVNRVLDVNGNMAVRSNIYVAPAIGETSNSAYSIEIGQGRTGNGYAFLDFVTDDTYTDHGLRIIRGNSGANTYSEIKHRGTGLFKFAAQEAANMTFSTSNSERMRIASNGNVGIGTTSPSQKLEVAGNIQATGTRSISSSFDANHYMRLESSSSGGILKGTDGGVITTLVRTYGDSYFNGGSVSIGTTSPGVKLHLSTGNSSLPSLDGGTLFVVDATQGSTGNYSAMSILSGTTGVSSLYLGDSDAENRGSLRYNNSSNSLSLGTNGSERMRIASNGNVGIGTTSPANKLDVVGTLSATNIRVGSTISAEGIIRYNGGSGNGIGIVTGAISSSAIGLFVDSGANNRNVGTEQRSPGVKLEVANSEPIIRLTDTRILDNGQWDNVSLGKIEFKTSDTTSPGARVLSEIQAYSSAAATSGPESELRFKTSTNTDSTPQTRLTIRGPNVGIGTTTPDRLFEVYGASDGYMKIDGGRVGNHGFTIGSDSLGFIVYDDTLTTYRLVIDQDTGNVGIGNTDPQFKLHVGGAGARMRVGPYYTSGGDRDFVDLIAHGTDSKIYSNNERFHIQNDSGDIIINPISNVGIGTTSPDAKLHVVGKQMITTGANASPQTEDYLFIGGDGLAGANASIYIGNRGDGTGYGWRMLYEGAGSGVNNKLKFRSENIGSPVDAITMLQDGSVGIGTTSPSDKLHVSGNIRVTGAFKDSSGDSGIPGQILSSTGSGTTWINNDTGDITGVTAGNGLTGGGTSGTVTVSADYSTSTTSLIRAATEASTVSGGGTYSDYILIQGVNPGTTTEVKKIRLNNIPIEDFDTSGDLSMDGSIQMGDDTDAASASKVGTLRYRTSGNNSYVDMCMQTGATTYAWVNIVQNNW